ncbi:MAG: type II secretion system protein GspM [Comamonas sp.]
MKKNAPRPPASARPNAATALLRQRWQALDARERRSLVLAGGVVLIALLWWLAIAPVIQTWRSAPGEHQRLDTQIARMQSLQTEARQLQSATTLTASQARQQLESSMTQQLGGSAKLSVLGERATVTLTNAPAAATQGWLAQVRANAHAIPVELRLSANTGKAGTVPTWSGTMVLQLPAQ